MPLSGVGHFSEPGYQYPVGAYANHLEPKHDKDVILSAPLPGSVVGLVSVRCGASEV